MAAISLFWYTNMAAVTSDENDLLTIVVVALPCTTTLKARLHLQFLLRFKVQFSSSDGCERVDKL